MISPYLTLKTRKFPILRTNYLFSLINGLILIITLGMMLVNKESHPIAILIFLISLLGSLYREIWKFDTSKSQLTYAFGFIPFLKINRIPFSQIEEITLKNTPLNQSKQQFTLCLQIKNGEELDLEKKVGKSNEILKNWGKNISKLTQIPLVID